MTLAMPSSESTALLATLQDWSEQGWLRRLDHALARFCAELCPQAPPLVLMASALLAHLEGQGHSCLGLADLLRKPADLLGWAAAPAAALDMTLKALPADPEAWRAALRASPLVMLDEPGAAAPTSLTPLVLRGDKLYLRRYWGYERRVAAQVLQRGAAFEAVDPVAARGWLDLLFPAPEAVADAAAAEPPVDWQKVACGVALRGRFSVITGGPGTGKTYTVARLLALLLAVSPAPERLRVALAAPTGKAAARLKQSIAAALDGLQPALGDRLPLRQLAGQLGAARTLHSLLGARPDTRRFRFDAAHPLEIDLLIVDEASMVHLEMMAALLEALPAAARVVFLGDKDQLASVEAGAVLGDLCRHAEAGRYQPATAAFVASVTGQTLPPQFVRGGPALAQQTVMLRQSRRFGGPIGQLALAVNAGDASAAARLLRPGAAQAGGAPVLGLDAASPAVVVRLALHGRPGAEGGYRRYLETLKARPASADPAAHATWVQSVLADFDRFRLLCAVREGDWGAAGLNLAVERALADQGWLARRGEWYEGRPVMVTRNDAAVGVFNGDIGIVLRPADAGAPLRAWFADGPALRSVGVSRLADVETAFAMTVHKAQGSEFDHTVLVLPRETSRALTRELVYTGITRARSAFTLVSGRPEALRSALGRRTRRSSGLLERLGDEAALADDLPGVELTGDDPPADDRC